MKKTLFVMLVVLAGCTSTSTVTFPDGEVFTLKAKPDAFVTVTRNNATYVFDRRGNRSLFEVFMTMMFMDTKLKDKVKE